MSCKDLASKGGLSARLAAVNRFFNLHNLNSTTLDYKYPTSSFYLNGRKVAIAIAAILAYPLHFQTGQSISIAESVFGVELSEDGVIEDLRLVEVPLSLHSPQRELGPASAPLS